MSTVPDFNRRIAASEELERAFAGYRKHFGDDALRDRLMRMLLSLRVDADNAGKAGLEQALDRLGAAVRKEYGGGK